jgi:tripartite ATP-independent transporter DctM subunit
MPQFGLALLGLVALGVAGTGLPVFVVLLMVSTLGAAAGVAAGSVSPALLGALPARLIGLLENDLLQAVPLFVFIGALLNRLPLADLLYRAGCRLAGRGPAAPRVAALGLSALLAPMNGSVGASVVMLSRVVAPRLQAHGAQPAQAGALVSVASTLGVLVPPSIVLLLLGDAMMAAHTQALGVTGRVARVLNTQDLLHGVLLPCAAIVALAGLIAAVQGRRSGIAAAASAPLTRIEAGVALLTVAVLGGLLAGVAIGWFFAVEAAASGALLLLVAGFATRQLNSAGFFAVLHDTLEVTGGLCALFFGATTFTLVLHCLGTDAFVAQAFARLPADPLYTVLAALAVLLGCGLVLDAYELIFVVVPILMPPVLMRVDDAQWVAVLALLALQISFLLPPLGYAVMMSSARLQPRPGTRALLRALVPYLLALAAVLAAVLLRPALVHGFDAPAAAASAQPALTEEQVEALMRAAPR